MALVTCYDPQGNEFQKEPVDARECCQSCGFTLTAPAPVAATEPAQEKTSKRDKE